MQITQQMVQSMGEMLMQGQFRNHPLMQQFNQMMAGKTPQQQRETLLNYAASRGYDKNNILNILNGMM